MNNKGLVLLRHSDMKTLDSIYLRIEPYKEPPVETVERQQTKSCIVNQSFFFYLLQDFCRFQI